MGKRKKTSNEMEDTDAAIKSIQAEAAAAGQQKQTETEKKSKRSKKTVQNINTAELPNKKSIKTKRSKQEEQIEIIEDKDSSLNLKTHINKNKIKKLKEADTKPKKVVIVDDTEISKNKKQYLNDEEAAVKDEDIDKFCDEIDEEDNLQYENWIKMIETTLHPPKKGP